MDHFKFLAGVLNRDYWIVDDVSAPYEGFYELNHDNVNSILTTVRASLLLHESLQNIKTRDEL